MQRCTLSSSTLLRQPSNCLNRPPAISAKTSSQDAEWNHVALIKSCHFKDNVNIMAYTREANETLEVSYPIETLWDAIPKAVTKQEWKILEVDHVSHRVKIKTKGAFLSYGSTLTVELSPIDTKNTRMTVTAETPVTTITSMADYGRTRERIAVLVSTLGKILSGE